MRNKKHLIALDLDGTLLTKNQEISPRTIDILAKAMSDGHVVIIATGRSHRTSIQHYRRLNLTTPMVNFNGAFIHHPNNSKWSTLHSPLSQQTALRVIDACYDLNVHNIMAKVQDKVYLDKHNQEILDIFQSMETYQEFSPFTIGNVRSELKNDPTSLLIIPRDEDVDNLKNHLNEHHAELIEHRNWGAPWNITEITKKGINKAVGLQKVADYYHIPRERIIAFGDGDNDLEMIEYAGVGVAMENAISELKSVATHITGTNELDGVAAFIENYFKIQVKVI